MCSVEGCDDLAAGGHGWCSKHWKRVKRHGDPLVTLKNRSPDLAERLASRVIKTTGCWQWLGATHAGYGVFGFNRQMMRAHRVSYELYVGPIPPGLSVLHRCDNPPCTNPDHLFVGTQLDNMRDMCAKGRARWQQ